jgi:predicted nucleic acid-binding protein
MTKSLVCVDSCLVIKLVVPEPLSGVADALWSKWIEEGVEVAAPRLLRYELVSVLRKKVYRALLTEKEAMKSLQVALALDISLVDPNELPLAAWKLSHDLQQPTAYDSHYLALAENLNCPFWTADKRLYDLALKRFSWVHWLGDYQVSGV